MDTTQKEEVEAYLANIRRTVEQSRSLIEAVQLRIAETDRLLERQGLTREEIARMQFTDEQRELVNAELRRHGCPPLEEVDFDKAELEATQRATKSAAKAQTAKDDFSVRQSKFGSMMRGVRI